MTDLDIGPVLRGLSAATRADEATGRAAGAAHLSANPATVGPGSLFRLLGRGAPSAPSGGADPAAAPPLHLTAVEDTAAVVAAWQ
ncbi:MAG: hypothetical protein PF508_12410, partial [Spirochaeta sp.]|nr:hypothetical protein [Spirochaeta sp.]